MTPDRIRGLESYTDDELLSEMQRRRAEAQQRVNKLSAITGEKTVAKNPRMSAAKALYWSAWHEYRSSYPDASLEDWRKAQKRKAK
jgi:hypothetical protein